MAQVIAAEVWQRGIKDPKLLPSKFTPQLFVGKGVNIANNGEACRVWDIQIPDFVTSYDDRRINGLANIYNGSTPPNNFNVDGKDGFGASAWGPMQDVRFDSRVYTMGRHRSCAFRIFDEQQHSGGIGQFGTATTSNYSHGGQALMNTAQIISEIKSEYEARVMGVDMDKYNLFAVCNGHISGRLVGNTQAYEDQIFDGDCAHYSWVAQPGPVQGQDIPPRFAPIQAMALDFENLPLGLSQLRNAWKTVGIDANECVICIDPEYEYHCMRALTGDGVPATANAYTDLQDGNFTKLMGYTFDFEIPTAYYPSIWVDANYNVVHSDGTGATPAYDLVINSISGSLRNKLVASHRMGVNNFVRTVWDNTNKKFSKVVTNYALGDPGVQDNFYGNENTPKVVPYENYGKPTTYPWSAPGAGYGLPPYDSTAPAGTVQATGPVAPITKHKVVGLAIYKKAAQLSQQFNDMRTEDGGVRAKCTEMVMDCKYDAWVIENLSAGIIPIIDIENISASHGIPMQVINDVPVKNSTEVSGGTVVDKAFKTTSTINTATGTSVSANITNTSESPVEIHANTSANRTAAKKTKKK